MLQVAVSRDPHASPFQRPPPSASINEALSRPSASAAISPPRAHVARDGSAIGGSSARMTTQEQAGYKSDLQQGDSSDRRSEWKPADAVSTKATPTAATGHNASSQDHSSSSPDAVTRPTPWPRSADNYIHLPALSALASLAAEASVAMASPVKDPG